MDYFLLDAKTGELHTARPLDREALPDATGLIVLSVRVSSARAHAFSWDGNSIFQWTNGIGLTGARARRRSAGQW